MKKTIVFGCGETATTARDKIHERFHVAAYADNNSALWGKTFDGVPVISPSQIPQDAEVVVASGLYYPEMINQVWQNGIRRIFAIINGEIIQYFSENRQTDQFEFPAPHREPLLTTLEVGLSGICNSKCRYCKFQSEYSTDNAPPRIFMSEEILDEICRQISTIDSLTTLNLVGCGETLAHPHWSDYVSRILKANSSFSECKIWTNGMLLTESNVEKLKRIPIPNLTLVVSIDGTSPEDCEYWRKGEKFATVRENIHRAYEMLGQNVNFVLAGCAVLPHEVNERNAAEVEAFIEYSVDWRKKEFPFMRFDNYLASPLVAVPGTKTVKASVFPKPNSCLTVFTLVAIWPNGDILLCPCGTTQKNQQDFRIGNVTRDQLKTLFYENEMFCSLRADLNNNKKPAVCGICAQLGESTVPCLKRTSTEECSSCDTL